MRRNVNANASATVRIMSVFASPGTPSSKQCPRANSAIGTLEATGMMREMTERLATDVDLAAAYRSAHEGYLAARESVAVVPEIAGVTAGGMPDRVKCLHVLVAHSLAAGPGANPLGDEALAALPEWWRSGSCVRADVGGEV